MRYTTRNGGLLARRVAAAAGAMLLASCALFTEPLPEGTRRLDPPAHFSLWWGMVEQCSGLSRGMSDIDWYEVPGSTFESPTGKAVNGMYLQGSERIVLGNGSARKGPVVRHEMLHALIRRNDAEPSHPAEYFVRKCGGVVECAKGCIATAGPIQAPPAINPVKDSLLRVTIEVDSAVSLTQFPDFVYVPLIARAHNPLAVPVLVSPSGILFELRVTGPTSKSGGSTLLAFTDDPRAAYFEPGETKMHVFDLYLTRHVNSVGEWFVLGGFGSNWLNAPIKFRVKHE
jgi:hypothetical protein